MDRRAGSGGAVLSVVIQLRLGAVLQFGTHVFTKCPFCFWSKNINIDMYRTIICLLFCMDVKLDLTLRGQNRLRLVEKRA